MSKRGCKGTYWRCADTLISTLWLVWPSAAALWVAVSSQLIPQAVISSLWQAEAPCWSRRHSCFWWGLHPWCFSKSFVESLGHQHGSGKKASTKSTWMPSRELQKVNASWRCWWWKTRSLLYLGFTEVIITKKTIFSLSNSEQMSNEKSFTQNVSQLSRNMLFVIFKLLIDCWF